MSKYLQERQYYINRYDLITIKKCLKAEDFWRNAYKEYLSEEESKMFLLEIKLSFSTGYAIKNFFK